MGKLILVKIVCLTGVLAIANLAQAQCVVCALVLENGKISCSVSTIQRDGHERCEACNKGKYRCDCTGQCESSPEAVNYIPGINWEDEGIPESGLRLFVPSGYDLIRGEALASAFLGSRKAANLFIGEQFGAFRAKANEYVLYPLVGSEFKLKDCNNEIIGKASRIPSPNT